MPIDADADVSPLTPDLTPPLLRAPLPREAPFYLRFFRYADVRDIRAMRCRARGAKSSMRARAAPRACAAVECCLRRDARARKARASASVLQHTAPTRARHAAAPPRRALRTLLLRSRYADHVTSYAPALIGTRHVTRCYVLLISHRERRLIRHDASAPLARVLRVPRAYSHGRSYAVVGVGRVMSRVVAGRCVAASADERRRAQRAARRSAHAELRCAA